MREEFVQIVDEKIKDAIDPINKRLEALENKQPAKSASSGEFAPSTSTLRGFASLR